MKKSHWVAPEKIMPAAEHVVNMVDTPKDAPVIKHTERMVAAIASLGYGVEYQAAALLHGRRVMGAYDGPLVVTPDYFYDMVANIPFCTIFAAHRLAMVRDLPATERIPELVRGNNAYNETAVALLVAHTEAGIVASGGSSESLVGISVSDAAFLCNALKPFLPSPDGPV